MSADESTVPALVPGNIVHEFEHMEPEDLSALSQAVYFRTTTSEPRQKVIDSLLREGWTPEAASWLYSQAKAKGSRIAYILERPPESPDLTASEPAATVEFKRLVVFGLFLMLVGIVVAGFAYSQGPDTKGAFVPGGALFGVGGGAIIRALTRRN